MCPDVQDSHTVFEEPIESFVWIFDKRCDVRSRQWLATAGGLLPANLKSGRARPARRTVTELLPIWLQKSFGGWTMFGGRGYSQCSTRFRNGPILLQNAASGGLGATIESEGAKSLNQPCVS
jgi:hypothetical protein